MNCDDVQRMLIDAPESGEGAGTESNEAVCEHLRNCAECRRFADDLASIHSLSLGLKEQAPPAPPVLRHRTLYECRCVLAETAELKQFTWWQRCRRRSSSSTVVASVVIVCALILWAITTYQSNRVLDEAFNLQVKVTVALIVIQNIIAALLIPPLIVMKKMIPGSVWGVAAKGD